MNTRRLTEFPGELPDQLELTSPEVKVSEMSLELDGLSSELNLMKRTSEPAHFQVVQNPY